MKYILLFLTIIYGGIYLPLWCGQYDKAAFFISMCVLFTQWCFNPRKASNPKDQGADQEGSV